MVKAPMNTSRRQVMQHAVALFAQESGFHSADRNSLELLTEMLQSILFEMGRTTRLFTELAGRVEPTVGDVAMAFIDMGFKVDATGLRAYSRRQSRPMVPVPQTLPLPKVPTILSTGMKRILPSYIPDYFPQVPDSHTYIRTPTLKQPITDHAACREKTSVQKRDLQESLTKMFARRFPCYYPFAENKSLFPLISTKPVTYLDPVIPRDQVFEDESPEPFNYIIKEESMENFQPLNEDDENAEVSMMKVTIWERIDNPFLKPMTLREPTSGHSTRRQQQIS